MEEENSQGEKNAGSQEGGLEKPLGHAVPAMFNLLP